MGVQALGLQAAVSGFLAQAVARSEISPTHERKKKQGFLTACKTVEGSQYKRAAAQQEEQ